MLLGADLSLWQEKVDWSKLASKVSFVILKTSEANFVDPLFHEHVAGAESVGLPWGGYHFWQPTHSATVQAETIKTALAGRVPDLELYLDAEVKGSGAHFLATFDEVTRLVQEPDIYTSNYGWSLIGNPTVDAGLWVANYKYDNPYYWRPENYQNTIETIRGLSPYLPKGFTTWDYWQFTRFAPASEYGVSGNYLDLDFYNGTALPIDPPEPPPSEDCNCQDELDNLQQQIANLEQRMLLLDQRVTEIDTRTKAAGNILGG